MARLQDFQTLSGTITSPQFIPCPSGWRRAETAIIRLSIVARNPNIGKIDFKHIVPRQWTGYYYLARANCVREHGVIEFKNQEIYNNKHLWQAELFTQSYVNELTTPDADLNELIDEGSMALALAGSEFLPSLADLNIPLLDPILEALEDVVNGLASDNIHYYPMPDRPDKLGISFRDGYASIRYEFLWIPYSPLLIAGGLAELSIEPEIEIIEPIELEDLDNISDALTFDDEAINRGYVPSSQLPQLCAGSGFVQPSDVIKNSASASGMTPQDLINELLGNSDILQSDIDAILAINPSANPQEILDGLIDNGAISISDINAAIASKNAPSPNVAILNNGIFANTSLQFCSTGRSLMIWSSSPTRVVLRYVRPISIGYESCQVYSNVTSAPIVSVLSTHLGVSSIVLESFANNSNWTGVVTVVDVTSSAKIIKSVSGASFQFVTLGDLVYKRGNTVVNTEDLGFSSRQDTF